MKTKTLLRLYLVMSLLDDPLFFGPVLLIAMIKLGHMSMEQIFLSEVAATGLILILDAPSGVLADMLGRKRCVAFGKIFYLMSALFTVFMDAPIHSYIANILWAISVSLQSGATSALIYDELQKRNELHEYPAVMKKTHSYQFIIFSGATLIAGFLAEIHLRLPLILSLPGVMISTVLIFFFPKEEVKIQQHSFAGYKKHLHDAMIEAVRNKRLRAIILTLATISVLGKLYFFSYNPYLELVHVPYNQVGIIFCALNILAFISSRYAFVVQKRKPVGSFAIVLYLQGGMMLVQGVFIHYLSGFLFLGSGIIRGYVSTISEPLLNENIESKKRATMLSFHSSISSLLQMFGFLFASPVSGNVTTMLIGLGIISLMSGVICRKV